MLISYNNLILFRMQLFFIANLIFSKFKLYRLNFDYSIDPDHIHFLIHHLSLLHKRIEPSETTSQGHLILNEGDIYLHMA
jgi:hypothetical protein